MSRPFPPPPPECRAGQARPPVAICLYDTARRTETWHSLVGEIRWASEGGQHVALVGVAGGGLRVAITVEVKALVEAFERARREATGEPPPGGGRDTK